jgi:hypothetical protein
MKKPNVLCTFGFGVEPPTRGSAAGAQRRLLIPGTKIFGNTICYSLAFRKKNASLQNLASQHIIKQAI